MAVKVIDIPGIGLVRFAKTTRNRSIKLTMTASGPRVTLPRWTPYAVAVAFVSQHAEWVQNEQARVAKPLLQEGDKIGKLHTLHFEQIAERSEARTRVTPTKLIITHHPSENVAGEAVQTRAEKAAIRALKKEATVLLPPRLKAIAQEHSVAHGTITVKNLKRRWGSCDSHTNITLNLFLMQLSWQQIDYVICHELAHIRHMDHSAEFWREVERMMPDARMIAKRVRHIQPALNPVKTATAFEDDMAY